MKKNRQTILTKPDEFKIPQDLQNITVFDYQTVLELSNDLSFAVYCYCQNLPREFRDTVVKDLKKNLAELATLINKTKTTTEMFAMLEETHVCLDVIGIRIRLLYGFNQLSAEQFTLLVELTDEISAQLQMWKKNVKKRKT
jgi:hypothetical protein